MRRFEGFAKAYRPRHWLFFGATLAVAACVDGAHPVKLGATPPPAAAAASPLLIQQAASALAQHDGIAAASFAELAVRAAPRDVTARALLAKAYMAAGRTSAAAQAYDDWVAAAPGDEKARLGRALARLAKGDKVGALADLDMLRATVDAGLGYALAGDTARGVELLTTAARSPNATARTRQNLALALALDGQWTHARTVAAQDLDPVTVEARIRDWTKLAASGGPAARTAALLGLVPATIDEGRPQALAWAAEPMPTVVAAPVQAVAVATPPKQSAPVAAPTPTPVAVAAVAPPVAKPVLPAPVTAQAMPRPPALKPAAPLLAAVAPRAIVRSQAPAFVRASTASVTADARSAWVVQIGAYRTSELLQANWRQLSRRGPVLRGLAPVESRVDLGARGVYLRLAVGDFARRDEAVRLCLKWRAAGGDCLVRARPTPSPVQLARI